MEKWVAVLAAPEKNKAKKLLKRYVLGFATKNRAQGRIGMVMKIHTAEARPIKQTPKNIPLAKRNKVKKLINKMVKVVAHPRNLDGLT